MIAPSSVTGSPAGRRSWIAQRPALRRRGVCVSPTAPGIPAGVHRAAVLAVVGEVEAGAVTAAGVERAVGPELEVDPSSGWGTAGTSPRSSTALAGPTLPLAVQAREPPGDHAAVGGGPGGVGQRRRLVRAPSAAACRRSRVVTRRARTRTARREVRIQRHARAARDPRSRARGRAGPRHCGGGSSRSSKTRSARSSRRRTRGRQRRTG